MRGGPSVTLGPQEHTFPGYFRESQAGVVSLGLGDPSHPRGSLPSECWRGVGVGGWALTTLLPSHQVSEQRANSTLFLHWGPVYPSLCFFP